MLPSFCSNERFEAMCIHHGSMHARPHSCWTELWSGFLCTSYCVRWVTCNNISLGMSFFICLFQCGITFVCLNNSRNISDHALCTLALHQHLNVPEEDWSPGRYVEPWLLAGSDGLQYPTPCAADCAGVHSEPKGEEPCPAKCDRPHPQECSCPHIYVW